VTYISLVGQAFMPDDYSDLHFPRRSGIRLHPWGVPDWDKVTQECVTYIARVGQAFLLDI